MSEIYQLHAWQKECREAFYANGKRGICKVATGGGKTHLALTLMKEQMKAEKFTLFNVIVSRVPLIDMWHKTLVESDIPANKISRWGGTYREELKKAAGINIMVVNSAIRQMPKMDFESVSHFLVLDESHNYTTDTYIDVVRYKFDMALGLSATPMRNIEHWPEFEKRMGGVIYSYDLADAHKDGVVSNFHVTYYGLNLAGSDLESYEKDSLLIRKARQAIYQKHGNMNDVQLKKAFARTKDGSISRYFTLAQSRKRRLYKLPDRVDCVCDIIDRNQDKKILIFHELVDEVIKIHDTLESKFPHLRLGMYHSKMKPKEKRKVLLDFKEDKIDILVSAKCLIEGINVPQVDVGIICASNSSIGNRVQSIGRIIRKSPDTDLKHVKILYVKDTTDALLINRLKLSKDLTTHVDWDSGATFTPFSKDASKRYPQNPQIGMPYAGFWEDAGPEYTVSKTGLIHCREFDPSTGKKLKRLSVNSPKQIVEAVQKFKKEGIFKVNGAGHILTRVDGRCIYVGLATEQIRFARIRAQKPKEQFTVKKVADFMSGKSAKLDGAKKPKKEMDLTQPTGVKRASKNTLHETPVSENLPSPPIKQAKRKEMDLLSGPAKVGRTSQPSRGSQAPENLKSDKVEPKATSQVVEPEKATSESKGKVRSFL